MNARERHDERLRVLEKEVAWLLEYRGAPLSVSDLETPSWNQQLKRLVSEMEDLHQQHEKSKKISSKMASLYSMLNRAFDIHSTVVTEAEERNQALRREDTAAWNREMAEMREQALEQRMETEKMQRLLETKLRKDAEREMAQAENNVRFEKMMALFETQMRKGAEEEVVRFQNELQEQRIQTLEKDLECRRAEAITMTTKAKEQIQAAHTQVAKAREERAEAREQAARLELEKEQLLKRIKALETQGTEGPSGTGKLTDLAPLPAAPTAAIDGGDAVHDHLSAPAGSCPHPPASRENSCVVVAMDWRESVVTRGRLSDSTDEGGRTDSDNEGK